METGGINQKAPIYIGDVHGMWKELTQWVERAGLEGETLIQVGDFNIGYLPYEREVEYLAHMNEQFAERGNRLLVMRGNHDNPAYFDGRLDANMSHIEFLPDYSVRQIGDSNILFIGGGISIDRKRKTDGLNWWSDEVVRPDWDFIAQVRDIDTIVTHVAPQEVFPYAFNQIVYDFHQGNPQLNIPGDPTLLIELEEERKCMSQMFFILRQNNPIRQHFYGHYHQSYVTERDGVMHYLIGIMEAKMV